MTKLVVVEARRLLPVALLFLVLVAVSLYDAFSTPVEPVTTQPNSVPYRTLAQSTQPGTMRSAVVTDLDTWVKMHNALGLELSDHDFNPGLEIAVFLINCQLVSTREVQGAVEMVTSPAKGNCQLVLFQKKQLSSQTDPQFLLVEVSGKK